MQHHKVSKGERTRVGAVTDLHYGICAIVQSALTLVKQASLILLRNHLKSSVGLESETNDPLPGIYCIFKT